MAALGGMVVPALIYVACQRRPRGEPGLGDPHGHRHRLRRRRGHAPRPPGAAGRELFLLALAVVDDLGAIVVIAIFYTEDVKLGWRGSRWPCSASLVTWSLRRLEVRSLVPYLALGAVCWYSHSRGGMEAAIAGVVFGLLTPVKPVPRPVRVRPDARPSSTDRATFDDDVVTDDERERNEVAVEDLARYASETAHPGADREPARAVGGVRRRAPLRLRQRGRVHRRGQRDAR